MSSPFLTVSPAVATASSWVGQLGALLVVALVLTTGGCAGGGVSVSDASDVGQVGKAADGEAIVGALDRTAQDRRADRRRRPIQLLEFLNIKQGDRVADLGAGGGYTMELLVRAVGPQGAVYGQNNALTIEKNVGETWPARLRRSVNKNVVRMDLEYEAPFVPEAKELNLVTLLFSYHDVVAQGGDRTEMNVAVYSGLKPGGFFVIADHSAEPGSGPEAASSLHRIEKTIVVSEVEAAGFELLEEADFLKDDSDDLTSVSYQVGFLTDRYILKFIKPE